MTSACACSFGGPFDRNRSSELLRQFPQAWRCKCRGEHHNRCFRHVSFGANNYWIEMSSHFIDTYSCRNCIIYSRTCTDSEEFKTPHSICSTNEIKAGTKKYFQGQADDNTCKLYTGNTKINVTDTSALKAFPDAKCCTVNGCNIASGQAASNTEGTFPAKID